MYLSIQTPRTLNLKTAHTIGISILLIGLMLPGTAVANMFTVKPYTSLVVISLGTDPIINHATDQIRMIIPGAVYVTVSTESQLKAITSYALREIIYVGHGLPQGLEIGSSIIAWKEVQSIVQSSPSQQQLFAACYSLLAQVPGKQVFGFKSLVDVDEAAMWVTSAYYSIENQVSKIPQIFVYFFKILVEKVINPASQLLAFLGAPIPNCFVGVKSSQTVQPNGCGGCGCACYGCGPPPPPPCNGFGQLYNGYCVGWIQAIAHVHWNTLATNTVFYTHPDVYHTYIIGYDDQFTVGGANLAASHLTKDDLSNIGLGATVGTVLTGAVLGAIIGSTILPVLGTAVGALIGAIVGLLGYILQSQIIDRYIRDETQAGWMWLQNWYNAWYGSGSDVKLGGLGWFKFGVTLGIPFAYPLYYGGQALGLSGW